MGSHRESILGPLLFIWYVNDLKNASKILDPIMLADGTNLFLSNSDIKALFNIMNTEIKHIAESLNAKKTKYCFFHIPSKKDHALLALLKLKIYYCEINTEDSIKFLGVLIDENVTWSEHIKHVQTKLS